MNNLSPDTLTLLAIAATLGGKQIRLSGQNLAIGDMAIHQVKDKAALTLQLTLPREESCTLDGCDCQRCQMSRAIPAKHAAEVAGLIAQGISDHFIFDSSFVSEDGFHVKIRHLENHSVSVGLGANIAIAIGRAVTSATPTPDPS